MLNVIVAPYEYNQNAEYIAKRIVRILKNRKVEYSVYFSHDLLDVSKNVKELTAMGESEFVCIGDDVVLNKVINSVRDLTRIKLGIIPTGKHDDFAEYLGISSNPIEALNDILAEHIEAVDFLLVGNERVLNNVQIGARAEAYDIYNKYKLKNFVTEKYAIMRYANKFAGIELTFNSKGGKLKTENIFDMSISNGGLSRRAKLSPLANVQDGLMNVNYSTMESITEKKSYLKEFHTGKQVYNDSLTQMWTNNIRLSTETKSIKAIVDGEVKILDNSEIVVIEGGLKIFKRA